MGSLEEPRGLIEIHLAELEQLFDRAPAPFGGKALDAKAEEFILDRARELPKHARLALLVHLDRSPGPADEPQLLRDAVGQFFAARSVKSRWRLRQLFRVGRISLLIGMLFLAVTFGIVEIIEMTVQPGRLGVVLRESLIIGGWVAMWRPLEIFLYEWWPIHSERRLFDRLSAMPVRITHSDTVGMLGGGTGRVSQHRK